MSKGTIAIVGAGPYGLSLAAHLAARNIEHRIIGHPMRFWSEIAQAGGERYLKSYCFGTNISTPNPGNSFAHYSAPRGLETFEPCSIADFAAYGVWFQTKNVPWVEPVEVEHVTKTIQGFAVSLTDGKNFFANQLVLATGLSYFAYVPPVLTCLPSALVTHTSMIESFAAFKGRSIAVVGGGQSALEAAALLREAGAWPQLLVREQKVLWNSARLTRAEPLGALALAYFWSRNGTESMGAYSFSRCDTAHASSLADSIREEPFTARRCVVAPRSSRGPSADLSRSGGSGSSREKRTRLASV